MSIPGQFDRRSSADVKWLVHDLLEREHDNIPPQRCFGELAGASFHQVDVVMEGLANLRPQLLEKLLRECKSVKVKRLFLWYADRHGHAWFKHLDQSSVDLGKGKRQLVPQGHFDARYQITLPMELFNAGGSNNGQ
jgi:Transcriptional regulator, AbiEi antitoxin, Type IV TA system